ncbi:hypothetical protein [Spelaeicoccus albus]|uniref:Uncharacterized protein n=1 Tax=Spelaeicoccus albus TaxID=1280376 RepID=A0A7Z0D2S4_9MICO|nr:hypothetical protein [Spelaeicoccus albus]NYI67824.1 hypothetical protein [Spelaeicoccus albus]
MNFDELKKKAADLAEAGRDNLEEVGGKLRDAGEEFAERAEKRIDKGIDEAKSRAREYRQSRGDSE